MLVGFPSILCCTRACRLTLFLCSTWYRPAENHTPRFGCRQSCACAIRDHARLVLSHRRHDMQKEAVGLRHVCRCDLDTRFEQVGDEGDIARETVQLRDEEDRAGSLCLDKSTGKLGTVILLAALDFDELCGDGPFPGDMVYDGLALCFQSKPAPTLPISADTQVGDESYFVHSEQNSISNA